MSNRVLTAWQQLQAVTAEAMAEPRVGDVYHEMFAFLMVVVATGTAGWVLVWIDGAGPRDGHWELFQTQEEFRSRFAYKGTEGYWVKLHHRDHDATRWL